MDFDGHATSAQGTIFRFADNRTWNCGEDDCKTCQEDREWAVEWTDMWQIKLNAETFEVFTSSGSVQFLKGQNDLTITAPYIMGSSL